MLSLVLCPVAVTSAQLSPCGEIAALRSKAGPATQAYSACLCQRLSHPTEACRRINGRQNITILDQRLIRKRGRLCSCLSQRQLLANWGLSTTLCPHPRLSVLFAGGLGKSVACNANNNDTSSDRTKPSNNGLLHYLGHICQTKPFCQIKKSTNLCYFQINSNSSLCCWPKPLWSPTKAGLFWESQLLSS